MHIGAVRLSFIIPVWLPGTTGTCTFEKLDYELNIYL